MKVISLVSAALLFWTFSFAGHATPIKATYSIDLNDADLGLILQYENILSNPFSINLDPGESVSGPLFKIWTDEESNDLDDIFIPNAISTTFNFILPEAFGGSVSGVTGGAIEVCFLCNGHFVDDYSYGYLSWSDPVDFYFGPKHDGHLRIDLDGTMFNKGFDGFNYGEEYAGIVTGTLTLLADATAVPEPGTLAIFGFGLLGLGVCLRRRMKR
ncbi:MAG TPA: PEP-CTERM sorting domain-containing protein [Gammaproteobacteria bacterium]|nr:PEP-CTERM sorting domain-containing protein [Gammaproteobacteria bacterium]